MKTVRSCNRAAASARGLLRATTTLAMVLTLSSCGLWNDMMGLTDEPVTPADVAAPQAQAQAVPAETPPPPLPFDEAFRSAANKLFADANVSADQANPLVIDPLVDGVTGVQYDTTRSMQAELMTLAREKYPQFEVREFSSENVSENPLVLVGTFTPVNEMRKTAGTRNAFRICLVLADLAKGVTVGKGVAFARIEDVDATPTPYFSESPTWRADGWVQAYINTCQKTKPGDPIDPTYLEGVLTASLISDGIDAYEAGRYQEALDLYRNARSTAAGDQLRVHNGIYMSNWKLGNRDEAGRAFGSIVDYGLRNGQLSVKYLFKPGSTAFIPDPRITEPYPIWNEQIAKRAVQSDSCLEITGHTSASGPAALNERLSLLRADVIKQRLIDVEPAIEKRSITNGAGSSQNIIGSGTDDVMDALDRRVEFSVIDCGGASS
ncbi:MAG: OmpA family protein [Geminicoccaceae bacterium]|nr:OmpA family protein [Geminicoccaceae bacterium]